MLVDAGGIVAREDLYNYLLTNEAWAVPLVVPKRLKTIPFEIFYHCCEIAKLPAIIYQESAAD
jgi:hypothetical protein